ncbi:MAG: hypothetical protein ACREFE_04905 [Limisphaerales bacterium]
MKPLSVTLPFAARFTDRETASRARERIEKFSESRKRDSGAEDKKKKERRWRDFGSRS